MTPKLLRILVTGIGGDLGQAIIKSLRLITDHKIDVFGCDATSDTVGNAFVATCFSIPAAGDADYIDRIVTICKQHDIHAVIPATEPEIYELSKVKETVESRSGTVIICQKHSWFKHFQDKLKCFRSLDGKVELASFADGSCPDEIDALVQKCRFPYIVKPRFSSGSKSIQIVHEATQLYESIKTIHLPVVQEYIDDTYGEFSIGIFVCDEFTTAIAFKRQLGQLGTSWYAENLINEPDLINYAYDIAKAAQLHGSCNIQVRKGKDGFRLLEINPRFSSLVAARAACGFRDLEWSVLMGLGLKIPSTGFNYKQIRFRRFLHEVVDFGDGYNAVKQWSPRFTRI